MDIQLCAEHLLSKQAFKIVNFKIENDVDCYYLPRSKLARFPNIVKNIYIIIATFITNRITQQHIPRHIDRWRNYMYYCLCVVQDISV